MGFIIGNKEISSMSFNGKAVDKVFLGNSEVWSSDALLPVGGRIFYIHNDNGATYKFFDASGNELTTQTVAGLATASTYVRVSGTPTADKFYVYDNTDHTYTYSEGTVAITGGISAQSICWGYYGTLTYATAGWIGGGKTNTKIVLRKGVPSDMSPNIWGYIKSCRDNKLNGCSDWFIASIQEQNQLKASGLVNWYSSKDIWSSEEWLSDDPWSAYYWSGGLNRWDYVGRDHRYCAFAVRSF